MRKNIYFGLSSLLVVLLIILIPVFMSNSTITANTANLSLYLITKIICGLMFVFIAGYIFFKPVGNGLGFTLLGVTVAYQFLPLIVRLLLGLGSGSTLWIIILLIVSLIIYISFIGGVFIMSKKMVQSEKEYEGHTIDIV